MSKKAALFSSFLLLLTSPALRATDSDAEDAKILRKKPLKQDDSSSLTAEELDNQIEKGVEEILKDIADFKLNTGALLRTSPSRSGTRSAPPSSKKPHVKKGAPESAPTSPQAKAVPLDTDKIYKKKQKVSQKFLDNYDIVKGKVEPLCTQFKEDYAAQKPTILEITDFSPRARIRLMKEIIVHKLGPLGQLPLPDQGFNDNYTVLEGNETDFWKTITRSPYREIVNKIPVHFKIKGFSYQFELRMTPNQPGSGKIYGISSSKVADTYAQLRNKILPAYKNDNQQFIEGFKLLRDYEVVRRLIPGDKFGGELPIITSHVLLSRTQEQSFLNNYLDKVLAGATREGAIKGIIKTHYQQEPKKKDIRDSLKIFHDNDEDSHEEYATTDDEEGETPEVGC